MFQEDVLQFDTLTLVKPDFRFTRVDLDLFLGDNFRIGPVIQIERGIQRKTRPTQAAVALRRHFHRIPTLNSKLALRQRQQLRGTAHAQRGTLFQILSRKIDLPRWENLLEGNLPLLHLFDAKEHMGEPRLSG